MMVVHEVVGKAVMGKAGNGAWTALARVQT